jgi:predicted CXXCH cytochrome family protein
MKKLITVAGLLAVCLVIAAKSHAYTPTSGTKIAGSKHDFSVSYAGNGGVTTPAINQCSTCHEMHKPAKMNPLWGRQDPTATDWIVQTHDVATPLTDPAGANGFIAASDFVKARSGMCLSCHDGVTTISNGVTMAAGVKANFGRDLSENHNLGRNRTAAADGSDALIRANDDQVVQVDGSIKYYIGCGSCHSMHDSKTNLKLVRNAALVSGPVCLNCHSTK